MVFDALAAPLRLGCKCSSGEIDEVSVNLRLTVQRGHSCEGLPGSHREQTRKS